MLFNSMQFVWFFILVVVAYFALPHRHRWVLLLGASLYFYMCWKAEYVVLLMITLVVSYWSALRMGRHKERKPRRKYLLLSLVINLGILFTFKYFNFFSRSLQDAADFINWPLQMPLLEVLLPVGISFYTFQALSYSIDVYRDKMEVQRHFGRYALFVTFFTQLVAGPIERASNLMPQFLRKVEWDGARVASGLRLMLWGFFKKLVVADRLAIYVNAVYNNPDPHSGLTLLVATYLFGFQIYCDFSGYTDIAIGAARVMGFQLMRNFERPYFSRSIPEFWHRWHISLSTWFRDYVYIPLGGNRVAVPRMYLNLFIVFFVSGIWHGANWTFMIWGALHGLYAVSSRFSKAWCDERAAAWHIPAKARQALALFITYQLANFAWIFFRANSLGDARHIVAKIFSSDYTSLYVPATDQFVYGLMAVAMLLAVDIFHENIPLGRFLDERSRPLRWAAYVTTVVVILLMGIFNGSQFIYFQF